MAATEAVKKAAGKGRRARAETPRRNQLVVSFSDAEYAAITDAAEASQLSRGAWLAETAQASINRHRDPLAAAGHREALAEIAALRVDLAKIGTNLNQVAKRANEGTPPTEKLLAVMRDQLDVALVAVGTTTAALAAAARRKR